VTFFQVLVCVVNFHISSLQLSLLLQPPITYKLPFKKKDDILPPALGESPAAIANFIHFVAAASSYTYTVPLFSASASTGVPFFNAPPKM